MGIAVLGHGSAGAVRIVMDTSDFYLRRLINPAAAGERIAIYSQWPDR